MAKVEPCKEKNKVDLYFSEFSDMQDCMHHCEKVGGRVPSVLSLNYKNLSGTNSILNWQKSGMDSGCQSQVGTRKGFGEISSTPERFLLNQRDFFYTGEVMEHSGLFVGTAKGSCAVQRSDSEWWGDGCVNFQNVIVF